MKFTTLAILTTFLLLASVSAFTLPSGSNLYVDLNRSYPLVLVPLDNNIWNITLWVNENNNWSGFDFSWVGTQYQLTILFNETGNYPFVINSTEVTGDIRGIFLVREPYNVTFMFFKDKSSTIFSSNKYVNNMAYVTAELTGDKTFFTNNYDTSLEPFVAKISDSRFKKPVWYSRYTNGVATLKLYERGEYAIRLIDGDIRFDSDYAVPNITKSYGTNVYIGKYTLTNSSSYNLLLTEKDLNPYRWLFNIIYLILMGMIIVISIFLFFVIPESPSLSIIFGLGGTATLTLLRIVIWIWQGF